MSWHRDRNEHRKMVEFHREKPLGGLAGGELVTHNTLEFNPGPPTRSRKAKSKIMVPGMHRTHKRVL